MSKVLMIIKPGSLSSPDIEKLEEDGYTVVEGNPQDVKIVVPSSDIEGNIMLKFALETIEESANYVIQAKFAKKVSAYLKNKT